MMGRGGNFHSRLTLLGRVPRLKWMHAQGHLIDGSQATTRAPQTVVRVRRATRRASGPLCVFLFSDIFESVCGPERIKGRTERRTFIMHSC